MERSFPQYFRDAVERAPNRLQRYRQVVDQISRLFGRARRVSIRARRNQLRALFTDFLETQIPVEKQLTRVASPLPRSGGF